MYEVTPTYPVIQSHKNIVSCPDMLLLTARGQQKPATGKESLQQEENALFSPREPYSQGRNKSPSSRSLQLRFYSVTGESSKINKSALKVYVNSILSL